jgi:predicted transcriptional regulator
MNLRTLIESILLESEIDNIIKNKKEKLSKGDLGSNPNFSKEFDYYAKEFIKNIPTPKKYISKFFDMIEDINKDNVYGNTYNENFETIYYYFNKWMLYKSKNLINKDILAQTYESLIDIVEEVEENQRIKESEKEIDKIYDTDRWLVIRVKSKEASCKYGKNAKWCISATKDINRFTGYGYSEKNYIYFVIDKKEKLSPEDSLYKMAILVNKKNRKYEVWDADNKELSTSQVTILNRFIPEIFNAIGNDVKLAQDGIDEEFIKHSLYDTYSLKRIKDYYERVKLKFNTDYSMLWMTYQKPNTNHWIEVDVDIKNNNISSTFYVSKIINNEETGERYTDNPISIISIVSNEKITKSNFIDSIRKLVTDLFKKPEVKQFFTDNPNEYFSSVKLYQDIENMGTKKVPQKAFITAIKLLKDKGEQNITTIRRIVDRRLLASHNVKPLLRSLYSFGLITLEKRGRNVMIVPTPKLVKTPLDKLI